MRAQTAHLDILGGGISGLAVGYYARLRGLPFEIFEADSAVGGNCRTIENNGFRYDTGAHRLHDRIPQVTRDLMHLLGADLLRIDVPSRIFYQGRYIDFPLSPINLVTKLGLRLSTRAAIDLLRARATPSRAQPSFESLTVHRYGRTIAEKFLLNYTQKLWGLPCSQLSSEIAGSRLQGLTLSSLLVELLLGKRAKTRHLEGSSFFYPRLGIGMLADRLGAQCGPEHIRVGARITRILHDSGRIRALEINGGEVIEVVGDVVSTLPLGLLVQLLDPRLPEAILALARGLRQRDLRLAVFFLDRPSVIANAATIYCPDSAFAATRWYEPRNRSAAMSPAGKTSVVAEVPCQSGDPLWSLPDALFIQRMRDQFVRAGWIGGAEVVGSATHRMPHAYPVIDLESMAKRARILEALARLSNLRPTGRNGSFAYQLMHQVIAESRALVETYA